MIWNQFIRFQVQKSNMKRRWCRNEVIINSWESTTQASALFGYSDCVLQYDKNVFIPSTLSKQSIPIRSNPKPPYYITKLTVIVSCANQVKLPYIQKIEDLKKSIMLLFFQCILPTPFLIFYWIFFSTELNFCPNFPFT